MLQLKAPDKTNSWLIKFWIIPTLVYMSEPNVFDQDKKKVGMNWRSVRV